MSNNIDFLPARYGEENARRRSRIWLLSILGIFASVIAITSSIQMALQKNVEEQLAAIEFQYSSAQATQTMFQRMQTDLAAAQATAGLYAYLEQSWPRTQILLGVSRPLTDEITLADVTIAIEAKQDEGDRAKLSRARRRPAEQAAQPVGDPATRDLELLKNQMTDKRTVVRLSGRTTNDVALHRYVSRLNSEPLFARAELLSIESSTDQTSHGSDFLLRVVVRGEDEVFIESQSAMNSPRTELSVKEKR